MYSAQNTDLVRGIFSYKKLLIHGDEISEKNNFDELETLDEDTKKLYSTIKQNRPQWCSLSLKKAHAIQRVTIYKLIDSHKKHFDNEMEIPLNALVDGNATFCDVNQRLEQIKNEILANNFNRVVADTPLITFNLEMDPCTDEYRELLNHLTPDHNLSTIIMQINNNIQQRKLDFVEP